MRFWGCCGLTVLTLFSACSVLKLANFAIFLRLEVAMGVLILVFSGRELGVWVGIR